MVKRAGNKHGCKDVETQFGDGEEKSLGKMKKFENFIQLLKEHDTF